MLSTNSPNIFFSYKSVVVVGASNDATRIGGLPFVLFKKYGFEGAVYGLNPKYDSVHGHRCFAQPEDLPNAIDVALFCLSADRLRDMLPRLAKRGLRGLVLFSAGFAESGKEGLALQGWLSDYAAQAGIAVIGPNCVGQVSLTRSRPLSFATYFVNFPPVQAGNLALLFQSGGIAGNVWTDAGLNGTRFSHIITTGNEADLGVTEYLNWLADDKDTHAVIGYIEAIKDGPAFCSAIAKMQLRKKPLVMLKVGRSALGRDAASSHTGQISSDDSGFQAAFDRYGVIRVSTLQELNNYARVFSLKGVERKVTVVSNSGGAGVYCADLCSELGLDLAELSNESIEKLSEVIPSFGRRKNPVDLTAQVVNDPSILEAALRILLQDSNTGVLIFVLVGKATIEQQEQVATMFKRLQTETGKSIIVPWLGVPEEVRVKAGAAGLYVYADPAHFLRPFKDYVRHILPNLDVKTRDIEHELGEPTNVQELTEPEVGDIPTMLSLDETGRRILGERAGMELLRRFGIECPRQWVAASETQLREVARQTTFPCVLKILQPIIAHKSDIGGVILNIASAAELVDAWRTMSAELSATEVMVVEQVERGVEILVGCQRDATFGLRLTVGAGGVWANSLNDTVTLIPPFTAEYVTESLSRLAIWAPLSGARGQPRTAVEALVQSILGVSRAAWAAREHLNEIECNPIIVTPSRAVAVDVIGFM